jgi:predicted protein tyrosine phosphatase
MGKLRRVEVSSRWDISAFIAALDKNFSVISITSPGSLFVEIPSSSRCQSVLQLMFDDIEFQIDGYRSFTPDQALEVRQFMEETDPSLVVCQCDYGISRSSAMAAALSYVHGLETRRFFTSGRYDPNTLVLKLVLQAYGVFDTEATVQRLQTGD